MLHTCLADAADPALSVAGACAWTCACAAIETYQVTRGRVAEVAPSACPTGIARAHIGTRAVTVAARAAAVVCTMS